MLKHIFLIPLLFSGFVLGQCPSPTPPSTPVLSPLGFFEALTMGGGQHYNRILVNPTDGTVWVAGYNSSGQHGTGLVNFDYTGNLFQISPLISDAVLCDAGMETQMVLKNDSTLWGWGSNWEGKIGDGTYGLGGGTHPQPSPQQAKLVTGAPLTGVVKAQTGMTFTVALTANHHVYAMGKNSGGAFGPSFSSGSYQPFAMELTDDGTTPIDWAVDIDQGEAYTVLLRWDSTVWVMGSGSYGQTGNNSGLSSSSPVAVIEDSSTCDLLSGVVSISAGRRHVMALKADGSVWSWGYNPYGQVGDNNPGTNVWFAKPVKGSGCVGNLIGIQSIEGSGCNSYAIDSSGNLYSWGCDDNGCLGDSLPNATQNCPVLAETGVLEVSGASGYNAGGHVMIRKAGGTYCFAGGNSYGIAGTGPPWSVFGPDLPDFECWTGLITVLNEDKLNRNSFTTSVRYSPTCPILQVNMPKEGKLDFQLFDLSGKIIWEETRQSLAGESTYIIPCEHLTGGIYMIKTRNQDGIQLTEKIRF